VWFEGVWVKEVEEKKLEERGSYRKLREITNEYLNDVLSSQIIF